jgi:cytochrome d ubiquinol oxidase subunit I
MGGAMSTEALFARGQMAYSLAFHIIFAAVGIAMPLLMVIAEALWRRTGDEEYLALAKRWTKGTAVFFAVGAVSGTVLSFELGLLFPHFMRNAGAVIGMPFSLEGFAFFTEAIFLGVYLYGWDRVRPGVHLLAGVGVAVSGLSSALFVTIANAWMNAPRGFRVENGRFVDVDPIAAMGSPFVAHEVVHTVLAAYMAVTLAVGAIHAYGCLANPSSTFHRRALAIALAVTIPCALAQPLVGHFAGQQVAVHQPLKLAAIERLEKTQPRAPLHLGPIAVPGLLSWLAFSDPDAVVKGLDHFPAEDHPHPIVRIAFQLMVALGSIAALYSLISLVWWIRRRSLPQARWWLIATMVLGPAGMVAMEAGWTVTEVGRQPWIIYEVMRTKDAITPVTGLWLSFTTFALVYVLLGFVVIAVLIRQVREAGAGR